MLSTKVDWLQSNPLAILSDSTPDQSGDNLGRFLQTSGLPVETFMPGWVANKNADGTPYAPQTDLPPPGVSGVITHHFMPTVGYSADTWQFNKGSDGNPFTTDPLRTPSNVLSGNGGTLPTVTPIDLTDKQSSVFARQPSILRGNSPMVATNTDMGTSPMSFKTRDANPISLVSPNDNYFTPEGQALNTIQVATSPIQANMAGNSAFLSGSDPMPVSADATYQGAQDGSQDSSTQAATRPSDCGTFDFACKWGTVHHEVYIFIIGAIILAIGIYAITRG